MGLDLSMLRTPDEMTEDVPALVRESPGYFRGAPFDIMDAAGIFDDDVEYLKFPDWPPAGLKESRAEQLLSLLEPPAEEDPVYSLLDLKPTYRELRVMQKYVTEKARARTVRSKKQGRVPALKFDSNDGWIVTPEECLIIAYRLRSYLAEESPADRDDQNWRDVFLKAANGDPDAHDAFLKAEDEDSEWVDAFVVFNEVAAKYGGYEVC